MKSVRIHIGGRSYSIDSFVRNKLEQFDRLEHDFASLFSLMFSEEDSVLYEISEGQTIKSITYGQAKEGAQERSGSIRRIFEGAPADSVIGLCMKNGPEWIETFWAILCAGYRPLLLNSNLDKATLDKALEQTGGIGAISDGMTFSVRTVGFEMLETDGGKYTPEVFGSGLFVMSSGTSSSIKICAYGAEEIYHQIKDSARMIRQCPKVKGFYNGQLKQLDLLPLYHVFGLVAMYIWFAFFSRTFVHLADLSPETIQSTIRRHEVTHVFAVPLFWNRVYEQTVKELDKLDAKTRHRFDRAVALSAKLSVIPPLADLFRKYAFKRVRDELFGDSIRFMISGGSVIKPEVLAFFNSIGYRLANGYGMSETGINCVELSGNSRYLNPGYVGKPMSSLGFRINAEGELEVSGKTMAAYVIENGEKKPRPEWFNTHDLACCDRGHYRILGRRDDLVIGANGENLNPNLIEELFDSPLIKDVCLIGDPDPVLICSVADDTSEEQFVMIDKEVREKIQDSNLAGKINRLFFTKDELLDPRDFKLNRRLIKEKYKSGGLTRLDKNSFRKCDLPDDELCRTIVNAFSRTLGKEKDEIAYDADFFLDLGGGSLDYYGLITELNEIYGVSFPILQGTALVTVEEFYRHIENGSDHVDKDSELLN